LIFFSPQNDVAFSFSLYDVILAELRKGEMAMMKVVGIASSISKNSRSRSLLNLMKQNTATKEIAIDLANISQLPLYNQDIDLASDSEYAKIIGDYREQIKSADGIVLCGK
jgi:NAD(P)H-dependent FMN reductase